jgi:hypothetical protein
MRRILLFAVLCTTLSAEGAAQIYVYDPAVTARNAVTAVVQEWLLQTERHQHTRLRQMAQRLSELTTLAKYGVPRPPRWRTHGAEVLFTQAYQQALTVGDPVGTAYLAVSHPVGRADDLLDRLSPSARRVMAARLATVDLTDAAAISATHETGRLRDLGRTRERPAIDALETHVLDPSPAHSTTAVLDTISGAVLLAARQRQARLQLLTAVVEQLLIDTARARNADAAATNLQLVTWRDGVAANDAFVAGAGDALRRWRQP